MTLASAYPNYRQPKMRWLPAVPEHWNEQRAKTFFREVDERSKTGQEELLSVSHLTGVTPRSQKKVTMFKAASYVGSKLCRPGDIVINTLWAWMAALGASKHVGIVSPAYGVYRPHRVDSFNPAYLDYLLRTRAYVAEYIGRSTGIRSSRLRLYPNQFLDIALLQPPRPEQDQIVAYLRAHDAHIARLIKAKRELIALLTEEKMVIVHIAITRGIDPYIALKKPSFEWVDEIPAHWSEVPLKQISKLNNSGSYGTNAEDGEVVLPVATTAQIRGDGHFAVDRMPKRGFSKADANKYLTQPGDILVVKSSGSIFSVISGKAGIVREDTPQFVFSNFLLRLIPDSKRVIPEYLFLLLGGYLTRERVKRMVAGTTFPNLQVGEYRSAILPIPSIEEQESILSSIAERTAPIDALIERSTEEIALIREYRDRLIADVVTGQVDVRSWQPSPDDLVDDAALAALGDDQEDVTEEEDGDGED